MGLNLLQSAFTNWCPTVAILQALGMKRRNKPAGKPARGAAELSR
ncbi:MAG TPA: hypothetical protein VM223_28930 [Planctomycetota bacterium]|nr:hypothetical protein [Planctomycetota bacterium]